MSFPPIHRVVTAHDADGKSVVALNGPLPTVVDIAALPGLIFHEVWETQGTPAPVDNGPDPTLQPMTHRAPANGTRIRFVDMPPDENLTGGESQIKELFVELNGVDAMMLRGDSPHPMMHRHEAVDYGIVLEGEVVLVLEREEIALRPGSVVIQRGTNHAWSNRSGKPCRMVFIQIDGRYGPTVEAALSRQ